jgi:hypothetical protein
MPMTAPKVRADYEVLSQIAHSFGCEADSLRRALSAIVRATDVLENGDWVGKRATGISCGAQEFQTRSTALADS